jgi:hypothetical protein
MTSRSKSSMFRRVRSAGSVPNWHITITSAQLPTGAVNSSA